MIFPLRLFQAFHILRRALYSQPLLSCVLGYYMYIDSQNAQVNNVARLTSPTYTTSTDQCLEIFIYLYGTNVGTLNIYVLEKDKDVTKQIPVWSRSHSEDDKWLIARTPVSLINKDFKVVFEATVGGTSLAVIAIDDFRIVDGTCLHHGKWLLEFKKKNTKITDL